MKRSLGLLALVGGALLAGCGGRAEEWDSTPQALFMGRLRNAAVLVDTSLNRGLVITARADQNLDFRAVRLGKHIASVTTSSDRERTFILSQGDEIRLRPTDEGPALTVLEADNLAEVKRYELPDALTSLALDPVGRYAIISAGSASSGSFIQNPNELIVVDLAAPPSAANPTRRTLPSNIGGSPQRFTFTPPMHLPGGERRLLVVETDRDVMLLDLENPDRPEVSLPVKDARTDSRAVSPEGISIDPGRGGTEERPPAIAIRTNRDDNVIIYTLRDSHREPPDNDFLATPNTAVVGAIPSDIAFVNTNQGPRLAVMVPSATPTGFLIKVDDSQSLSARFAASYQRITPVAGFSPQGTGAGDQLLLWSTTSSATSIAFWDLDKVPDMPSGSSIDTLKSIETLNLNGQVASVVNVPQNGLKIVETSSRALYVLEPQRHRANALNTTGKVALRYSKEGDRAWAFEPSQKRLSQIALPGAHTLKVDIERPVADVLEIERNDGGRALLAFHASGAVNDGAASTLAGPSIGVTAFDALSPNAAESRLYAAVLLERLAP